MSSKWCLSFIDLNSSSPVCTQVPPRSHRLTKRKLYLGRTDVWGQLRVGRTAQVSWRRLIAERDRADGDMHPSEHGRQQRLYDPRTSPWDCARFPQRFGRQFASISIEHVCGRVCIAAGADVLDDGDDAGAKHCYVVSGGVGDFEWTWWAWGCTWVREHEFWEFAVWGCC